MVPPVSCSLAVFPGLVVAIFLALGSISPAQETKGETLLDIPSRFFQVQDENGFFWQVAGNGALTSGETQYLQSGLNWLVEGAAFEPASAIVRAPDLMPEDAGVTLTEEREALSLTRDLKVDRERGAIRVLDSIKNTGAETLEVEVVLRTTYPFAWQSLHGSDGELLSKDPVLSLGEKDIGFAIHFSAAEGRHDTLLLTGGTNESLRPRLSASTNRRELSLIYKMVIPAGGTQSLLHWIAQRAMPEMSEIPAHFDAFYSRGQLVRNGLAATERTAVSNFPLSAFPSESSAPGGLKSLIALNLILDQLGVVRKSEDVQFLSASNRVSGTVSSSADLVIAANHIGEITLPLAKLAAIRGSGGIDRKQIFYLRDGQVRVGHLTSGDLTMTQSGSEKASPLDLAQMNLLTLRTSSIDGVSPKGATHFFRLVDQSVFAVNSSDDGGLPLATAFGGLAPALADLVEIGHVATPYPAHRIRSKAGSIYSAFFPGDLVSLALAGNDAVEMSTNLISEAWLAGASSLNLSDYGEAWLDVEEAPLSSETGGILLVGNQFLQSELLAGQIIVRDTGGSLSLDATTIRGIERDLKNSESAEPGFIFEMKNGETIRGAISSSFLSISWEGTPLDVPLETFIAYRSSTP